ncbi:MAG: hypothetical protein L0228_21695 [Planctomycetes bacterium]|nr:hypothetical protein [Planctomycetota bacterium]
MLDKNVGDALLKLDLTPQTDPPAAQIERVIDADRRRIKRWTRISIALWVLAALGAVWIFILGGLTFPVIAKMINEEQQAKMVEGAANARSGSDTKDVTEVMQGTLENPNTPFLVLAKLTAMCMVFGSASFMILVFAGLATVLLLLRSRSATLRQINANLLQISEQLKRVPPEGMTPATTTG